MRSTDEEIIRTDEQIQTQLDRARVHHKYQGMTFGDGVRHMWDWLTDPDEAAPFEDDEWTDEDEKALG